MLVATSAPVWAQLPPTRAAEPPATQPSAAAPATPSDPLGRDTPRGTLLGFLKAARDGDTELASQYVEGRPSPELAHQLFVVLDLKLPPRLTEISDEPEGSRTNPLRPDIEVVGAIATPDGSVDVVVQRVQRGKASIWLFPASILEKVPAMYAAVGERDTALSGKRLAGFTITEWLVAITAIPLFLVALALLNAILVAAARRYSRRFMPLARPPTTVLPMPVRLLLLAALIHWLLRISSLSLIVRQFWANAATAITIVSIVWLLILLNGVIVERIRRRHAATDGTAVSALVRIVRRIADVVFIVIGLAVLLRYFGVDPTPALAGLGVGGIAVALAAQKTLENVIAGASLIVDQAVRVGDVLKVGDTVGTVDHIGLRSTRIRTFDRTIVSIPNGQIASTTVETISARDKFWFHPQLRLSYETTPLQLRTVLDGIRALLERHPSVDPDLRVSLERLGPYSFDVEVFAYVFANNWNEFLKIQEQLLIGVTEIVERAGTSLAVPAQTPPAARVP